MGTRSGYRHSFRPSASGQAWQSGWSAGGAIEYAFMPTWSIKLEYLHYALGNATYACVLNTGNIDMETVKIGVPLKQNHRTPLLQQPLEWATPALTMGSTGTNAFAFAAQAAGYG